jgi:hypothetical protein
MTARMWWRAPLPCPVCGGSSVRVTGNVTATTLSGRFVFEDMTWLRCQSCEAHLDLAESIERLETGLRRGSGTRVVDEH